jgi:phage baseplate assembly protein W
MTTLSKIYSDIDLTFSRIPGKNDIALSYDDKAVIRSVRNLLMTNFYDRPFQPKIGSNINKLLFEPISDITASIIQDDIITTIQNYEPRVSIASIEVVADIDNTAFNVKLQFYIGNNSTPTAVNLLLQRSR